MNSRKTEDSLALLGGALLGAAAMYFMDPQAGRRRRHRLSAAAEGVVDDALGRPKHLGARLPNYIAEAEHRAAEYAGHLANQAHGMVSNLTAHAADHIPTDARRSVAEWRSAGGRLWNRARDLVRHAPDMMTERAQHVRDDIADRADDWRKDAAGRISRVSHQAQSWLGHEERHGIGAGTVVTSTIGCCMVGAGLMYFMDPRQGQARRSWIANMTGNCIHRTGQGMRSIGKDVADWFGRGKSSAQDFVNRARIDSEQLIRRIRSEVSHLSSGANQVQFMADADGTVTITGNLSRDAVDEFLTALHRVPGVEHVINRLSISENAGRGATSAQAKW